MSTTNLFDSGSYSYSDIFLSCFVCLACHVLPPTEDSLCAIIFHVIRDLSFNAMKHPLISVFLRFQTGKIALFGSFGSLPCYNSGKAKRFVPHLSIAKAGVMSTWAVQGAVEGVLSVKFDEWHVQNNY